MDGVAGSLIRDGSRVLLITEEGDEFLITVGSGKRFESHLGVIPHEDLIGKPLGSLVKTSKGITMYAVDPGYVNDVFKMRRRTQIVYPKDSGFILLMLNVTTGSRVIDVGVGSGAMSYLFARAVGDTGKVYAYEKREDFYDLAMKNLREWGVLDRVELKLRDISKGIDERNVDAFFLDVPDPWNYLHIASKTLRGGGRLCVIVPTTNQVQKVLETIENLPLIAVEVWESLFRRYKPVAERLRPFDRMVAHTTYMIFATRVLGGEGDESGEGEISASEGDKAQEGASQDT